MALEASARVRRLPTTLVGVLAALLLPLALAPRAEGFIYFASTQIHGGPPPSKITGAIGRANLDGTGVEPSFITVGGRPPWGLAVDAAHVYWTNADTHTIGRANLDSTGVDQSFITGASGTVGLAVDAAHLYWADPVADTIGRANLDGTGVEPSFITGASYPWGVAVDAAHVYWSQQNGPFAGAIARANLNGTGVEPSFITGFPTVPEGLAVDANHIYWTQEYCAGCDEIWRANIDGTGVEPSFITGVRPYSLAVDAAHVYWLQGSGAGTIGRANLDGTGVEPSFSGPGLGSPGGIAVSFSVGKLKKDKKRGTAKLTLEVPAPGTLALAETKKVRGAEVRADVAGNVQLAIKPKGKAKKKLAKQGKAKVKAEVTYTPDGGEPEAQVATLRLKR